MRQQQQQQRQEQQQRQQQMQVSPLRRCAPSVEMTHFRGQRERRAEERHERRESQRRQRQQQQEQQQRQQQMQVSPLRRCAPSVEMTDFLGMGARGGFDLIERSGSLSDAGFIGQGRLAEQQVTYRTGSVWRRGTSS